MSFEERELMCETEEATAAAVRSWLPAASLASSLLSLAPPSVPQH